MYPTSRSVRATYPGRQNARRVPADLALVLFHKIDNRAFGEYLARAVQREAARLATFLLREGEVLVCPIVLNINARAVSNPHTRA